MPPPVTDPGDIRASEYVITNVFCPPQLPSADDHSIENDYSLATAVATTARLYSEHVGEADMPRWHNISRMLENLQATMQNEDLDRIRTVSQFSSMDIGDVLALFIRAQNAGVIFRKQKDVTIFESFELSPLAKAVMSTRGNLICSYPGPAIEIPNDMFYDKDFLSELTNFLVHMNHDRLDANSQSSGSEDTAHPRYITELLTGILRSIGRPSDIPRISKHVGDDVVFDENSMSLPWRRSSLWLLIRVALQTTMDRSPLGHNTYKEFMLFFICRLAGEKASADRPNHLLHFMSIKISQRLWKLGSSAPDWLSCTVLETCTFLRSTIENRWTQLSPLRSRDYIRSSLAGHFTNPLPVPFSPDCSPRCSLDDLFSSNGTLFEESYRMEPCVALYDVEQAIEQGIDSWVSRVKNKNDACVKLEILVHKYSSSARKTYANNPELLSIMLLSTMELWAALDKIAIKDIPMLADYSPEVPIHLLERLLLFRSGSLCRLRRMHQYLSRRHSRSRSQWSVFSSATTADSFAVRFYRRSFHLQSLKARIEEEAQRKAHEKITAAWLENDDFYKNHHLYDWDRNERWIDIYEWPLPTNQLEAEVVVFELDCPISFNMWRSATFHLLVDLCSPFASRQSPKIQLNDDTSTLEPFHVKHPRSRISLGSNTRSSWCLRQRIPTQREVCIENGLTFFNFDTYTGASVSEALGCIDNKECCTYELQSGPYHNLQKYVDSVSHTSNEVIANQAECHKDLSIHEYVAFGHLRSGGLVQWLNILRELRGRSLNFRRPEVHMMLAQAASQVGPFKKKGLAWHQEIQRSTFCRTLLGELRSLVLDSDANWLEAVTMDTVSFLLRRLLASNLHKDVDQEALELLRTVRNKVFIWVQELSAKLEKTPEDEGSRGVLRDTSAICRGMFDVDPALLPQLLRSTKDIEVLLFSAIIIHENLPSDVSRLSAYSRLLLERDRRLSLTLESAVSSIILGSSENNEGVDFAVSRVWPAYRRSSEWTPLPPPNSRWFSCTTEASADQCPQVVHLNILNGLLLVDGKPLGTQLPDNFVRHPLYKSIFGEVIPGGLPGMDYSTRNLISEYHVYFSLRNNASALVIRAKRKQTDSSDPEIIELIPREKLVGDLPAILLEGYVHWLNLSTSVLEIRPLSTLWKISSDNWKMDCTPGHYSMWKGHERLLDPRSQSWKVVANLFKPLCNPQDLIVTVCATDPSQPVSSSQLSVHLPRYDLSFYVDEDGDLQSRSIRGMVYDENQYIRALFGLVNRLVLRPKIRGHNIVELIPRCVLIPVGECFLQTDDHHVRVEITADHSGFRRVMYQTYKIDTDLGCLTGDAGLTSKLYCAYLHALTSGYSTDPLTGRSGTEEALNILRSASCWSTVGFGSRDAQLLSSIASICTPKMLHSEYPMERCGLLPLNLQNHDLFVLSKAIKEHYEGVVLCSEPQPAPLFKDFPFHDSHPPKRTAGRAAYLFPSAGSVERSGADLKPVLYPARDLVGDTLREHRAYTAATSVHRRTSASTQDIWKILQPWSKEMYGEPVWSLRYDKSWLAPKLPMIWLKTYNLLRKSSKKNVVPIAFLTLRHGICFDRTEIHRPIEVQMDAIPVQTPCAKSAKFGESLYDLKERQHEMYYNRLDFDAREAIHMSLDAWPCQRPPPLPLRLLDASRYDVKALQSKIESHFSNRFRNLSRLRYHLTSVQKILDDLHSQASLEISQDLPYSFHPSKSITSCVLQPLTVDRLFARPAPPLRAHDTLPRYTADVNTSLPSDSIPLHQLLAKVDANAVSPFQRRYVSALRTSADSLGSEASLAPQEAMVAVHPTAEPLIDHYARCRTTYVDNLHYIKRHLGPSTESEQALEQSGQWPCVTAYTLFQFLASNSPISLSGDWKRCLTKFTLLALELQRVRRLLLLYLKGLHVEFRKELQNEGCDGWDAETYPDWLLIQLEGDFLIRRVQAEVANEMISPRSNDNTAMQLNMGEGKSSVIVPIIAAILADGNQLVRVIIPKSLATQTLHILIERLSGLAGRRVYYLPFSRSFGVNKARIVAMRQIMLECMQKRSILVVQPEHVLSLKLVSVEKQLPLVKDDHLASLFVELQSWLCSHSRDILDECDQILDVRSHLIFTIGHQRHMNGSSERWITTQQVLALVHKNASSLKELFPHGVEYESGLPESFSHLRILQADAGRELISWIANDIMDGMLPNVSFEHLHPHSALRDAIRCFISREDVPPEKVQLVKEHSEKTSLWGNLLLLRGLLNSILLFAFMERRWRVDFGLSPIRTLLAVPYQAKDIPAQRAEFGHLDIAIVLTCLSYYYGGLSEEQLKLSFEILLRQLDPSSEYDLWVRNNPTMPHSLRTFHGINLESVEQWNKLLFPLFSRNRATIDFYLSRVVFPREVNEFPSKLSSSGWDLAEKKERLLTGFSGTNDGQYLLPLHITQRDPNHQRGTNAMVLSYLLQPENKHYMCMADQNNERRIAREFLQILAAQKPEIRVLLDVGAQMLDLQNQQLAEAWLDISRDASAAIYFSEDDELMVRTRDGRMQPLRSSSFAQQLDRCVVYLDDAHTRGTDLKFPIGFRGAVTLGPKVTKDRLVQGCMRMRKLGHGHSIMFFAPLEIDWYIRSVAGKTPSDKIDTTDILLWSIQETWENVRRWAPHWVQQGMDHNCRYVAWSSFCDGHLTLEELTAKWLQPEAKGLEELYEPYNFSSEAAKFLGGNEHFRQRCVDLGVQSLYSTGMDEEQERELVYEFRREQQVERPPKARPVDHLIHQDIVDFVKTGVIPTETTSFRKPTRTFEPVFDTLDGTFAATNEAYVWSQSVLATKDFETTVELSERTAEYVRPVHWIISAKRGSNGVLVLLSPYEVNSLLPNIRSSRNVHLHLYTPRITRSIKPCDDFSLYNIPEIPKKWIPPTFLMSQLNVFAGQLYMKDYDTYIRLSHFLCMHSRELEGEEDLEVEVDGFILPKNRIKNSRTLIPHTFESSPTKSLKALMYLRSKDIDFTSTHMGKLLHGRLVSPADFED